MKSFNLQEVQNDEKFRAYAAGFSTSVLKRLAMGHKLDWQEQSFLAQFDPDVHVACNYCIEAHNLDVVTQRLKS
jgi:hypothetical protein